MFLEAQSRRGLELADKQDRIGEELKCFREKIPPPPQEFPWEARVVLSYIHEHLFDPSLNVAAVRRDCRLRNNNISTRFRCLVGIGLKEYIEARRLQAAHRLLCHADLEVYLIAMSVGYDHQETFFRAFQRRTGCTPSEWRLRLYWKEPFPGCPDRVSNKGKETPFEPQESEPENWRILP
jgi:AraC-like DNA-binding protein